MREAARAAAGEDDPERTPDQSPRESRRARVARLGRREPVVGAWLDGVEQRAERSARRRPEDDEVGVGGSLGRRRAVGGRDEQRSVGLARAEVAPDAGARLVDEEHVRVLVLGPLHGARAGGLRVQHLDGAVRRQRARERRGHSFEWDVGIEPPQGDERRPGGRRGKAAARLQLRRQLARDRGGEARIPLHQLDEPPAAELQQGRVADRLDGRRPHGAGEQRELADGRPGPEDTERPPVRVDAGHGPQAPAQDDVEVLGVVPFADEPLAREHAAGVGVGREGLERLRVRSGEERDARQRGAGDTGRAQ